MVYTRQNQSALTAAQKKRFVSALLAIKRSGQYDEFVRLHVEFYVGDGDGGQRVAHMASTFLPWHRQFLLEFEGALQRVDPGVSVPYWDWTVDRSPTSSLWGEGFLGGNGRRSDRRVTTGPFAYGNGHWPIKEGVTEGEYLTRDFGRPHDPIELPTKDELAWAMQDALYDSAPWNSTSSRGFRNKVEGWTSGVGNGKFRNHNRVHRWVGGHMLGADAVNDPVFWLNHAFVDLLWSRWHRNYPDSAPYLPAGGTTETGGVVTLDEPMPPWKVKPSSMIEHEHLYRYA
ncbi:tyrosinase family protein [Streptomyces sp. NBC_01361]|uniref:tyrosinase family protein n=1 Tax=Streptomyces sp. NBC_01361 TaxID=2903838 RepID=UPI002E326269|nr:tyrosinase family protein [Streptomyces sp. NBC_01361]